MTLIGSTNRTSSYNRSSEGPDWKRRSERLVRATGRPYTIVRPGWFDYNGPDDQLPVLLQGDLRRSGRPSDGAISRRQIAQVLGQQLPARAATDPPGLRGPAVTPVAGDSPAGAAHLALRRQARTQGRNTEELLQLYALGGFLARLSSSTLREPFVLKGGVLLAALAARRPTRDVDLAALDIRNDADTVLRAVREVLAIELPIDDGIAFDRPGQLAVPGMELVDVRQKHRHRADAV
jgi:hypothetical protein